MSVKRIHDKKILMRRFHNFFFDNKQFERTVLYLFKNRDCRIIILIHYANCDNSEYIKKRGDISSQINSCENQGEKIEVI